MINTNQDTLIIDVINNQVLILTSLLLSKKCSSLSLSIKRFHQLSSKWMVFLRYEPNVEPSGLSRNSALFRRYFNI